MDLTFMAKPGGRIGRVIAGVILIALGIFVVNGTGGIILIVVGAVPFLAGLFDVCVFSPLFGGPFLGPKMRGES